MIGERLRAGVARSARGASPVTVAVFVVVVGVAFVVVRLWLAADGDVTRFVVVGDAWADPATLADDVHVTDETGYDGQFFYRLAIDPLDHDLDAAHGIRLDTEYRLTRIAYPALAWVVSIGDAGNVPVSLIAVNLIALGVLAWQSALLARDCGRPPFVGLLVVTCTGLVMGLSRNLSEVMMVAAFVTGAVLVGRARFVGGAAAWSFAVLVHEQVVPLVLGYGVWRLVAVARRRSRPGGPDLPWAVPGIAFVGWQVLLWWETSTVPVAASSDSNAVLPFTDLLPSIVDWAGGSLGSQGYLTMLQLAVVVGAVVVAVAMSPRLPERFGWLAYSTGFGVLLASVLSDAVWEGPADLRQIVVVPAAAFALLVASTARIPTAVASSAVLAVVATVAFRGAVI